MGDMDESLIPFIVSEDIANCLGSVRDMSCCAPRTGHLMRGACTKLACKLSRDTFCLKRSSALSLLG